MPQRFYRPELDIVRLLAFLSVFVHHAVPETAFPPGSVPAALRNACGFGLCLFFALSAFLITTLLLRERAATGGIALLKFYQRRVLRIWPLYLTALACGALWSVHIGAFPAERAWFLAALLLGGNLVLWPANLVGHLWSISIEEQFYLLWPGLMQRLNRRHLYYAAAAVILLANATLLHFGRTHALTDPRIWGNTFVQFEMFAAGVLLALLVRDPRTWPSSTRLRVLCAACLPAAWFCATFLLHIKAPHQPADGPFRLCLGYALVAASCALLIYALLGSTHWPRPLVHMGRVSYGLYVFHLPVLDLLFRYAQPVPGWLRRVVALALTSVLALLSYRFLETPFLKLKSRLEIVPSRPVSSD